MACALSTPTRVPPMLNPLVSAVNVECCGRVETKTDSHTHTHTHTHTFPSRLRCAAHMHSPRMFADISRTPGLYPFSHSASPDACADVAVTSFRSGDEPVTCSQLEEGGHCMNPDHGDLIRSECPVACGMCRDDSCQFTLDSVCDEPYVCATGTDCTDCGNCDVVMTPYDWIPVEGEASRGGTEITELAG
jgi:hypothetical protein